MSNDDEGGTVPPASIATVIIHLEPRQSFADGRGNEERHGVFRGTNHKKPAISGGCCLGLCNRLQSVSKSEVLDWTPAADKALIASLPV